MNSVVFLEWFENQLMPALKNLSLVVLDNASYHNVKNRRYGVPKF
jgi:transposase